MKEAYKDLSIKIRDEDGNNPWQNVFSHASNIFVESSMDIIKNLKKLASDFENKKYQSWQKLKKDYTNG